MNELDDLITELDANEGAGSVARRRYNNWVKMALAYPHGWNSASPVFDEGDLDVLESLAFSIRPMIVEVSQPMRENLASLLTEILTDLGQDEHLPADLKNHIFTVVSHCRNCIDEYDILGAVAYKRAVDLLFADLVRAAYYEENGNKWRDKMRVFWHGFVQPLAVNASTYAARVAIDEGRDIAGELLRGGE